MDSYSTVENMRVKGIFGNPKGKKKKFQTEYVTSLQEENSVLTDTGQCHYQNSITILKCSKCLQFRTNELPDLVHHVNKECMNRTEKAGKWRNEVEVYVMCTVCDYRSDCIERITSHTKSALHKAKAELCWGSGLNFETQADVCYYKCLLCKYTVKKKARMVFHLQSVKHELKFKLLGKRFITENGRYIMVKVKRRDDIALLAEFHSESHNDDIMTSNDLPDTRMQTDHDNGEDSGLQTTPSNSAWTPITNDEQESQSTRISKAFVSAENGISSATPATLSCFLCMEFTGDDVALQRHLVKNHEVKTEVLQKFMSLVDLSTNDILQKRKTGTEELEIEHSESASNLPVGIQGRPSVTSLSSICEDSDGLVIDLDKDLERVDSGNCESVRAENGSLTEIGNENAADRMELQGFTANETPPSAEHVNLGIQQAAAGPVYNCWHYGCNEFFPNAADVQLHYLDAHARDHEELPVAVTMTKELQCAQCDQVFRKKEDFNKHRYCHEMDKAVECSSCQHRFQSIVEFRRHMQVVHCEELTTEQQALYEASVAAASSLALLGASGLENMTAQASKRISPLQTGKGKTLHGTLRPHAIENQSIAEKMDGRLDENSNSCLQAKFEGSASQGSGSGRDERMHKCDGTCGQNGMVSKCSSCKAGLSQVNGLLEHHQHTEKSRRKRSIPTKTITSPSEDKPSGENELTPTDLSVMDLTGRRSSSVDSETLVMSTAVSPPFTSPSVLLHRPQASVSAADRPFRCAVCKVSYSQKTQLDSHILSQQHVSRCAKAVDSTARQAMSSPAVFSTPYSSGDQGNFADLLRQQKFPIGQFLQYGIPFMNPMMSPVLSNYAVPPIMMQSAVENDVRVPTSSTATTCYKNSSDVPSTVEPMSRAESVPTKAESSSKSMANDDSVGNLDLACSRCHKVFPTVEVMNQHQLDCLDATPNILAPDPHNNGRGGGQTMMDSILQKIGYECVKQFNEFRQKPKHSQQMTSVLAESGRRTQPDKLDAKDLGDCLQSDSRSAQTNGSSCIDLAESRNVYVCPTCSKCFSDIFVLKSHQEIVHMEIVPIDVLEKLQQDLRRKCEKARIVGGNEEPKVAEKTRIRRQDSAVTVRSQPNVDEEEMKMKQQQLQLAAAYQSMQLGLMMSMGMLPQVPQRLSGPTHMAAISELFAQQPYSIIDPVMMMQLQQQQNKSASASATAPQSQLSSAAGQKSARTRISEQQLQILRANFDINNSPTEEQIQEMSEKTGLVTKVIKHWFRNTLFKERQRNKDSPYNFNNPPATTLNLEDYERSQALLVKKESSIAVDENSTTSSVNTTALTNANTDTRTLMITEAPSKSKPFCNSESSNRTEESYSKSPTISDSIGQPIISGSSSSSSQGTADIGSGMIRLGAGLSPMTNALYGLSPPVNWQERRAGRTRFSNQQIQVLQEFFDRNPYPKDDEVESLSRVLGLGIRVIVVWFQNARQRVRKTEGQSSSTLENPRTSQYQCGKCSALFDQHLEFLRHQMSDHAPSGDVVSRAASQSDSNEVFVDDEEAASRSSLGNDAEFETPSRQNLATASRSKVECDRCDMVFDYEEQLSAHQRTMHGGDSILPRMTARNQSEFGSRKSSEDGTAFRQSSDDEEHRGDRRMRTTLAQDQLDYLYEKFAIESNPSRPALEEIAAHLNLKPRVVQVWFQNTRARERRGQHRVNAQKTIVKCGFCESVFRGKAALDAHVAECHSSHLNVLAYPIDLAQTIQAMTSSMEQSAAIPPFLPPPPLVSSPMLNPTLQTNMNYLYEKSLKQYMTKLSNLHVNQQTPSSSASNHSYHTTTATSFEPSKTSTLKPDDVPLDLTTTSSASSRSDAIKVENDDLQNRLSYQPSLDDSYSETYSENDDALLTGRDSTSPSSALGTNPSRHSAMLTAGKRYRTQMSSVQIKVMRTIFNDYKTPSLAECEVLGQQIGLPRRVVQVWFQNSRAKMKKSSFLGLEKPEVNGSTSSSGGAFPGICVSLSECGLCNVAYGVNHTMQDHLFTKMHIDHIMAAVNTNEFRHSFANSADGRDTESIGQRKSSSSGGDFSLNQSVTISSMPNSSNSFESAAGNVLSNSDKNSVVERKQKRVHETSPKVGKEQQNETKKNAQNNAYPSSSAAPFAGPVENSLRQFMSVPPASAADLMGMMMPYFYQAGGIPAIFPGLAPIQLLSQAPNILQGVPNAIFNPAMCGIQLAQLQIPKRAIEQIQERLKDKTCSLAHYSEDCLSNAELRSRLTPNELASLSEQMIHVGFICKKCHLVFPQVSACNGHQAALCYKDAEKLTSDTTLKLEQLVYHCSLCKANCSTAAEFKTHCGHEKHRKSAQSGSRCGRTAGSNGSSQARFGARRVSGESRAMEQGSCNGESMSLANVKLEKSDG